MPACSCSCPRTQHKLLDVTRWAVSALYVWRGGGETTGGERGAVQIWVALPLSVGWRSRPSLSPPCIGGVVLCLTFLAYTWASGEGGAEPCLGVRLLWGTHCHTKTHAHSLTASKGHQTSTRLPRCLLYCTAGAHTHTHAHALMPGVQVCAGLCTSTALSHILCPWTRESSLAPATYTHACHTRLCVSNMLLSSRWGALHCAVCRATMRSTP